MKIKINMLSKATSAAGQGVGSAYLEQVKLVSEGAKKKFEVTVNEHVKADILHIHTINPTFYFRMLFTKAVTVCYVHFLPHTLDGSIKLPKPIFWFFKKYVISFYRHADHLVVVNPIFIKELEQYNVSREKIHYIPNFVSKEQFFVKPKEEKEKIRDKYNISKDKFVVLSAGQVQTRKGVLDFVEVAKKMPEVEFVWCGGFSFGAITDGYKELKKIYENPPKNVKFLGIIPREEMNDMFNACDLVFMPSYNELFPMVILEAANINKPMLLRDLDLYEDILFKKYMSAHDNKGFIRAIRSLINDKKIYDKYSNFSKDISEFYSKEHVLDLWIDFYNKIYKDGKK